MKWLLIVLFNTNGPITMDNLVFKYKSECIKAGKIITSKAFKMSKIKTVKTICMEIRN